MGESHSYWLIQAVASSGQLATIGGLSQRNGIFLGRPELKGFVNSFVCSFFVDDIDAVVKQVGELGGIITQPKRHRPGLGWRVQVRDTEMNVFGLIQRDAPH